jgi:pimeloyl-ACP methyl ester carboxylesterase
MTDPVLSDLTLPLPDGGHLAGSVAWTGSPGCVLYVHGFGSDRTGAKATALRTACAGRGWSFAAFDFRGHGRSSGTMRQLRGSGLQADLQAIASYLAERGARYLFPVGSSLGGMATAWFALAQAELVPAVVLLAPAFRFLQRRWGDLSENDRRRWQEEGVLRFRNQWLSCELEIGLVQERDRFDPERLAEQWRVPALIFHGMKDEVVPWQDTLDLVSRTPFAGIQLRLLGDGDHRLEAYRDETAREACRFFARWLGAPGAS